MPKNIFLFGLIVALLSGSEIVGQQDDTAPKLLPVPKDTLPEVLQLDHIPPGFTDVPAAPASNPLTAEKAALGRRLFFDPILSADGTVACATCHRPDQGFADSQPRAVGIGNAVGKRNAPSLLNRGYGEHFFWDGRSATLEEQALGPISSPNELGNEVKNVLVALRADESYKAEFGKAFGTTDDIEQLISSERLGQAIASFERTLVYGNTKVDRFRASEYSALSKEARQGMWIFESAGGCWKCHGGENFTDEKFHNTGVSFGETDRDDGRLEFTQKEEHRYQFKTPSLRGVSLTAPYMHDGSIKTLREVVEFYNKGGSPDDPGLDSDMKPLNLSEKEIGFLVEFLKALSQ